MTTGINHMQKYGIYPFMLFSLDNFFLIWLYFSTDFISHRPSITLHPSRFMLRNSWSVPHAWSQLTTGYRKYKLQFLEIQKSQMRWISWAGFLKVRYWQLHILACHFISPQSQMNKKSTLLLAIGLSSIHSTNQMPWWITIWRKVNYSYVFCVQDWEDKNCNCVLQHPR